MFRGLRLRLTALYLLAAMLLLVLIGLGTYRLLDSYFQGSTDQALQHKLAQELGTLGVPLPAQLASADRSWYSSRGRPVPPTQNANQPSAQRPEGEDHSDDEGKETHVIQGGPGGLHVDDYTYDPELAAIFVMPLTSNGNPTSMSGQPAASSALSSTTAADVQAVSAALSQGTDWRTVSLSNGTRVRLLTYQLPAGVGPAVLQLGRTLGDQDRILNQLLMGMLALGSVSAVLLGVASWWLAGRSLRPAQEAWERQQSFVANASHELRTPLTLMRASAEVAQRGVPARDADQHELLGDIIHEADHMTLLVEDLLLLSRLDAGRLAVERKAISVPAMFEDVQRQVGRVAGEKAVSVVVGDASGTALGDVVRLRQVLLILLDNALKHTPRGGSITLSAQTHGRNVLISVTDTGSGISPEHLPNVFERFYKADSARGVEGGTGLGLSIARGLVEAQHGQIAAESKLHQGTRITITLPAAKVQPGGTVGAGVEVASHSGGQ